MRFSDIIKKADKTEFNRPKADKTEFNRPKAKQTLDNKCHTCYQKGHLLKKANVFIKTQKSHRFLKAYDITCMHLYADVCRCDHTEND